MPLVPVRARRICFRSPEPVLHGYDHIITIKADDGYRIEDVVVDGISR